MADESFTGWHVRLRCDAPGHVPIDPSVPDICDDDLYRSQKHYRKYWREAGWTFHRDGRLTCPDCTPTPPKGPAND